MSSWDPHLNSFKTCITTKIVVDNVHDSHQRMTFTLWTRLTWCWNIFSVFGFLFIKAVLDHLFVYACWLAGHLDFEIFPTFFSRKSKEVITYPLLRLEQMSTIGTSTQGKFKGSTWAFVKQILCLQLATTRKPPTLTWTTGLNIEKVIIGGKSSEKLSVVYFTSTGPDKRAPALIENRCFYICNNPPRKIRPRENRQNTALTIFKL